MNEFILFLQHPRIIKRIYINWYNFFKLLLFVFLIHFPFGFVLHILIANTQFLIEREAFSYNQYIVKGLIMAPLIEEVLFRLLFIPTKRNNTIFVLTIIITLCINTYRVVYKSMDLIYVIVPIAIIIVYILFLTLYKYCKINIFSDYYFKYLFFTSALLFGFFHVFNFYFSSIFIILLIIPQLIDGAILGFIRLKYGFAYAIFFHILINGLGLLKYL